MTRRLVGSPTVEVRPCDESDLPLLAQALPLEGPYDHAYRFRGQQAGRWCYLLALEPGPVGACLVHWDGPTHDAVHRLLPDVVEVTSLYVAPHARGRGAGRTLMQDAERRAAQGGRARVGVAVGDENDSGATVRAVEEGDFLVKRAAGSADR